ncbi:MAG: hypothetical protein ISS15_12450 [Alphaproteobacteria bacterium]|nr:hypothetical protein [Alphaproteobacteria bacterium]MBL6936489.1 hypothetical protein [Alphaproteobacteria bacterium]MBL7098460.1 hypothetical protein [Alphaproteobacteria bacterium]
MRRLWAAIVLPLAVAACGPSQEDAAAYADAVRCYNASSMYSQMFLVTGEQESTRRLLDHAKALRSQAIALGDKIGKDEKAVTAEFKNDDTGYLHRFYIVGGGGSLTPTGFAASEVLYCNLTPLLQQ